MTAGLWLKFGTFPHSPLFSCSAAHEVRLVDDGAWTTIVELQLRPGARLEVITGTRAALTLLTTRWPTTSGTAFLRAQEVCLAALDNQTTHEVARAAFIAAAREAELWIRY